MSEIVHPKFNRVFKKDSGVFSVIGNGSIGGKGTGLKLIMEELLPRIEKFVPPDVEVSVPTMAIIGTDVFSAFMDRNDLDWVITTEDTDEQIAQVFQQASFPAEYIGDVRALITDVKYPLAVRSSSLLEDDLRHPFAGVYATKLIPNNKAEIDARFQDLLSAIKYVYASVFFRQAKHYLQSVGKQPGCEKMAVVIQEIVGEKYGEIYYPTISGVLRSYNHYPTGHGKKEDGVTSLAFGLGKTIVDGGRSWNYCPEYPRSPPPFNNIGDMLKNTQTKYWAVDMRTVKNANPLNEDEYLTQIDFGTKPIHDGFKLCVSTVDPANGRVYSGYRDKGPKILDFSPILAGRALPLNEVCKTIISMGKQVLGCDVEIELAAKVQKDDRLYIGILQIRPMPGMGNVDSIEEISPLDEHIIIASDKVLGSGKYEKLYDLVYVKPQTFEPAHTSKIALEIEEVNKHLIAQGKHYILIGFGRWGSSDPWLGIPVCWGQISGVRLIVESTLPTMNPDLSQGSHFFHNMISLNVLYMAVPQLALMPIRWEWLQKQQACYETAYIRHICKKTPFFVHVDSYHGKGVLKYGTEDKAATP